MRRPPPSRAFVFRVAAVSLAFGLALAYVGAWYDVVSNGKVERNLGSVLGARGDTR